MNSRLLVVKTSAFGDIVQTFYVIEDIKRARPDLEIFWCVDERFAEVAALHPSVSRVITFPSRPWRKRFFSPVVWRQIVDWIEALRVTRFDIAIDLQGMYKSAFVCWISGAARKIGRTRFSSVEGFSNVIFSETYDFIRAKGLAGRKRAFTGAALHYDWKSLSLSSGLAQWEGGRRTVLVVGASSQAKVWSIESWQAVAFALASDPSTAPEILWGTESEKAMASTIASVHPDIKVAERLLKPLELLELYRRCNAVVGADTGPTHLAASLGVPTVMIFKTTSPESYTHPDLRNLLPVGGVGFSPSPEQVLSVLRQVKANVRKPSSAANQERY